MRVKSTPVSILILSSVLTSARCEESLDRCPPQLNRGAYLKAFRNKCYDFVTYDERTWNTAKTSCESQGGSLAVIPDSATQNFFSAVVKGLSYSEKGLWIGLTDTTNEGNWKWVTGDAVTYNNWESGHGGVLGFLEDCALFRISDGKWVELPCGVFWDTFGFICQFDMVPSTAITQSTLSQIEDLKFLDPLASDSEVRGQITCQNGTC